MKKFRILPAFSLLLTIGLAVLSACLGGEDVVFPDPKANFSFDLKTPAPGEAVTMINGAVNASTFMWSFEQGKIDDDTRTPLGTSDETDPQFVFDNTGTYTVTLEATNKQGATDQVSKEIVVAWPGLFTEFTTPNATVNVFEEVEFTNNSLNAASYEWDFGDGSATSSEVNPKHQYSTAGTYTVTLAAVGLDGSEKQFSVEIIVEETGPVVNFSSDNTVINTNGSVTFTPDIIGNTSSVLWEFEGGSPATSTDMNPTVSYEKPGVYNVKLSATNSAGTTEELKEVMIEVQTAGYPTPQVLLRFEDNLKNHGSDPNDAVLGRFATGTADFATRGSSTSYNFGGESGNNWLELGSYEGIKGNGDRTYAFWTQSQIDHSTDHTFYSVGENAGFSLNPDVLKLRGSGAGAQANVLRWQYNGGNEVTPTTYNDGQWHHVAIVWKGSEQTIYFYVDGVLVHSKNKGIDLQTNSNTASDDFSFRIGVFKAQITEAIESYIEYHEGSMDDFYVFDSALTDAQIQAIFNDTDAGQ